MRSTPWLLTQQLEKNLAPFYLLYGSESFLIEESASVIRQRIRRLGETEHMVFTVENENTLASLTALEQPSLFTPRRIIELKLPKLSASLAQKLAKILQSSFPDTYFLIQAGTLNRQQQQATWFTAIEQNGVVVAHWPLSSSQFSSWVEKRAAQRGLQLSPQTLLLLVYHTEGNCLAASQEIERLALINTSAAATEVKDYFAEQSHFDVFDLCEAALSCQPSRVIKIASCLKESGTALQLVLWALGQTLRTLIRCATSPQEASQRLRQAGIRPQSHEIYLRCLKKASISSWSSLLPYLSQADKQLKSGEMASAWRHALNISLKLAGVSMSL